MEEINLLEAIERFVKGAMHPDELQHFEAIRINNAEIDELVVQHSFFLHQLETAADRKALKSTLDTVHANYISENNINNVKVISLKDRLRKKMAIAASVVALVGVSLFGIIFAFNAGKNNKTYQQTGTKDSLTIEKKIKDLETKVATVENKTDRNLEVFTHGTGFIVNENGYILTNQHVINKSQQVYVYNEKYGDLTASVVLEDEKNDLAVLKITDTAFKKTDNIPYSFKNMDVNLAQKVYTVGYSRPPYLTYNEGFVSSKAANATYNNTNNFLLTLQVEGGNSGSPILSNNGDIIGIVSAKEKIENGFTLGLKTMAVKSIIDALQTQTKLKMKSRNNLMGLNRDAQIKKLDNYIFMVKSK